MNNSKKNAKELSGKIIKKLADGYLHADANSATCMIFYQPKAPKELNKFKVRK